MQPDEAPAERVSEEQTTNEQSLTQATPPKKKGVLLPILLMIAPGLLIIASILLYAVANFFIGTAQPTVPADSSLFGEEAPNPARAIINIFLFLMGAVAVLGVIPCFVLGLILLIKRLQK